LGSPVHACLAQRTLDPTQVIGRSVIAADGSKVGEVADVSTDETGEIDLLRVTTGIRLGLGERHIVIPRPAFMIKAATIVLPDFTPEDVAGWPDDHSEGSSLRQEER
jgi:sporulation protein YlmC with PRC-barrel domain